MPAAIVGSAAVISADPLGIAVAFGAGIVSFLSPCVLPLVPGYVSMVSGLSAAELEAGASKDLGPLLRGMLGFIAGFTVVFTVLGATASALGRMLLHHQRGLEIAGGITIVVLGAWLAGLGAPRLFHQERRFHPRASRLGVWAPPVMGVAFAFGWTPCIGPVLSGVLGLAATRSTMTSGLVLLVAYSLGLGVPFLLTGLAFGRLTAVFARVRSRLWIIDMVAGAALVAFGVLLLTGNLHWVSSQVAAFMRAIGLSRLSVS
ncbi:MAG TPA: cytochrome c biogenesis protein CcdA [Acidimicrobiales bacterium]|nr:cytochrome c biogenesis protein CcdA [Acidimicrobiales bacterium]